MVCGNCNWEGTVAEFSTHFEELHTESCCNYRSQFEERILNVAVQETSTDAPGILVVNKQQVPTTPVDMDTHPEPCYEYRSRLEVDLPDAVQETNKNSLGILVAKNVSLKRLQTFPTMSADDIIKKVECFESVKKQLQSIEHKITCLDFQLSVLPEKVICDGSITWKISQFSQRNAAAENSTPIFSRPFYLYSGRCGYKMCLCLYIMGDGIGKGSHLSLFFAIMRGEFDNNLQWPFTHKVTFKLINQAGGQDIVDTFQPDPTSSSFKKPISDMNIASGCPCFISHAEFEKGGFITVDTIFIKCTIDTSTIRHP